jgi:predicted Zn-dependent protease
VEPRVRVLISPGQRREAIQATALHELGHAFGLWGHSDDPADAMAVSPGSQPILRLSARDRATVRWLYGQPTPMRSDP